MKETLTQAKVSNDGRPTCTSCHCPTAFNREYRATGLCGACYTDQPLIIETRRLLHGR